MTFLAPIAGIVGAAIAVPILIALYLLKLRRRVAKVSTIALWEAAVRDVQANVPLRWIKPSWLLALQMLGLACLLMALARPALPTEAGVRQRTIFVIDHSAAMSARDGVGPMVREPGSDAPKAPTRLDEAKRKALDVITQMESSGGRRAETMVIALAADAQIVQGYTSDTRRLREAIESIGPTDQPGLLEDAARLATAGASTGEVGDERSLLLLFTDGGLEASNTDLPGSMDAQVVRCGPAPIAGQPGPVDNLGIVAISARRDAEKPGTVRVFVRIQSVREKATDVTLLCTVDGQPAGAAGSRGDGGGLLTLSIPGMTRGVDGVPMPGEASGTFTLERSEGGLVVVTLPRADVLESDNTAAVVLKPASKPRVLVVGADDTSDPLFKARGPKGVDRFLLGVLNDLEPAEVRVMNAPEYAGSLANAADAGSMPTSAREKWDLVIFDRVAPERWPNVPTISIGAIAPIDGLKLEAIPAREWAEAATRIISWRRTHPILRYAALDSVLVSPPMRMTISDSPSDAAGNAPVITPLAFGKGGPLLALVEERGPRRIKRIVIGFDLLRTNWGREVSFPVFISSAIDTLTGRGEAASGLSFTTREPIALATPADVDRVKVTGPELLDLDVIGKSPEGGTATLGVPRFAGVYQATIGSATQTIAVNIADPRISTLATREEVAIGGRPAGRALPSANIRAVREIWSWWAICAGILLSIEWFVYAWRMRS